MLKKREETRGKGSTDFSRILNSFSVKNEQTNSQRRKHILSQSGKMTEIVGYYKNREWLGLAGSDNAFEVKCHLW